MFWVMACDPVSSPSLRAPAFLGAKQSPSHQPAGGKIASQGLAMTDFFLIAMTGFFALGRLLARRERRVFRICKPCATVLA